MCLMRFERNFLKTATLIVLVWAYPCEMKTSYGNLKNAPFCLDRLYAEERNFTDGIIEENIGRIIQGCSQTV